MQSRYMEQAFIELILSIYYRKNMRLYGTVGPPITRSTARNIVICKLRYMLVDY
jgi:hypothetical protein